MYKVENLPYWTYIQHTINFTVRQNTRVYPFFTESKSDHNAKKTSANLLQERCKSESKSMRRRSRPAMTTMAAVATEEWSAAEGRQQQPAVADVAAAVAAAAGPDQLTGSESAARGAPLGRTGCWAQPGQLVAASVAASVASVGAAEASGASVVGAEVAEQEPPHPEGALLRCAKVFRADISMNRCILSYAHSCTAFDKMTAC